MFVFTLFFVLLMFSLDSVVSAFASTNVVENSFDQLNSLNNITLIKSLVQATNSLFNTDLFVQNYFATSTYEQFVGLDTTSIFSSSIAINENFAVVGSNGYDYFEGIIHIYTPIDICSWTLQSLIRSPSGANDNFGTSVAVDGLTLITGANARNAYTGIAYIYSFVDNAFWQRTAALTSPLGIAQGFGYKAAISGQYAMVSTAVDDAFIYENYGQHRGWSLSADLASLAHSRPGSFFGQSIALEGEFAFVGADQANGSFGAVHIFNVNNSNPQHVWSHFQTLPSVHGIDSFFGHSLDLSDRTLVVGAPGHVKGRHVEHASGLPRSYSNNTGWIHVYNLVADNSSFVLTQSIQSPVGADSHFGASVAIHDVEILVGAMGYGNSTGAAFVYRRTNHTSTGQFSALGDFELKVALASTQGAEGHFGFITDISADHAVVGSYGSDDLRGGVSLVCRSLYDPAPMRPSNHSVPLNTTGENNSTKFNLGEDGNDSSDEWTWGVVIAIVLGVAGGTSYMMYRVCLSCCYIPPVIVKKKKKEEEDSPYTVHGAGGLMDESDGSSIYSADFLESYADTSISADYDDDYSTSGSELSSGGKGRNKDKKGSLGRSEERVRSYAGYREGGDKKAKKGEKRRSCSVYGGSTLSPCKTYGPGGLQRSDLGGDERSIFARPVHSSGLPRSPRGTVAFQQEQELNSLHSSRQNSLSSSEFHSLESSRQHSRHSSLGSNTDDHLFHDESANGLSESTISRARSAASSHYLAYRHYKEQRLQEEQDRVEEAERVRLFFELQRLSSDQFDSSSQTGLLTMRHTNRVAPNRCDSLEFSRSDSADLSQQRMRRDAGVRIDENDGILGAVAENCITRTTTFRTRSTEAGSDTSQSEASTVVQDFTAIRAATRSTTTSNTSHHHNQRLMEKALHRTEEVAFVGRPYLRTTSPLQIKEQSLFQSQSPRVPAPHSTLRGEQESLERHAQFMALQDEMARQRVEEDRLHLMAAEQSHVWEVAVLTKQDPINGVAQDGTEVAAQQEQRDCLSAKEQSRLRTEQKARERFQLFKTQQTRRDSDNELLLVSSNSETDGEDAVALVRTGLRRADELLAVGSLVLLSTQQQRRSVVQSSMVDCLHMIVSNTQEEKSTFNATDYTFNSNTNKRPSLLNNKNLEEEEEEKKEAKLQFEV